MWTTLLKQTKSHIVPHAEAVWGANSGTVRLVSTGVNLVFRFEAHGAGRYLRINVLPGAAVAAALDFLQHVASMGAPVCRPVRSASGRLGEELATTDRTFVVTAAEEVPGEVIRQDETNPAVYQAWGRSLAPLHEASRSFNYESRHDYHDWTWDWEQVGRRIETAPIAVRAAYDSLGPWLQSLPVSSEVFGLTHADFRAGNVTWDGRQVHIFDFDEPTEQWFAADVARPFIGLTDLPIAERRPLQEAFLRGYRAVRPVADRWVESLPRFMQLRALDGYTWLTSDWLDQQIPGGEDRRTALARLLRIIKNPPEW
jgi:Ser/Thr protein kinase RdoA (MazF antagonist)